MEFYAGTGRDDSGRLLEHILLWPDEHLENHHNYIQWMFPLRERSAFHPEAPVLTEETIAAFRRRPELRRNLHVAFVRMLKFYGFALKEQNPLRVVTAAAFPERARVWLNRSNHNHLRITRMLKSLRLLGLEAEADAFYGALEELQRKLAAAETPLITAETAKFWREAAGRK